MSGARAWLALLWGSCVLLLAAADAAARPGGGHTFSGGGSSSSGGGSGGGSGGDGELIFFAIRLAIAYPKVGVPVLVVAVFWYARTHRHKLESWDSATIHHRPAPAADRFDVLRRLDPQFSRVLLEDFAYRLFAAAHQARHDERRLAALAPYLSGSVRTGLGATPPSGAPAVAVVVGSFAVVRTRLQRSTEERAEDAAERVELDAIYEANITVDPGDGPQSFYVRESWTFARDARARTKPPGASSDTFGCPNCAAPFESADDARCNYCGEVVADARFDWQARSRSVLASEVRPPLLTGTVVERGTHSPTRRDPNVDPQWAAVRASDPSVSEPALRARLARIYAALNDAWSRLELVPVRGYVSDNMFEYLSYWVKAYRAQGLRNQLENMRLTRHELVKVVRDVHFDAVTVRLWATGIDYTVEARSNTIVGGSAGKERPYSEYWTLIRGAQVRGQPRADASCPSCAAPLKINMAGTCEYCNAHVTRGEFDWVLSKIEQDEVYRG